MTNLDGFSPSLSCRPLARLIDSDLLPDPLPCITASWFPESAGGRTDHSHGHGRFRSHPGLHQLSANRREATEMSAALANENAVPVREVSTVLLREHLAKQKESFMLELEEAQPGTHTAPACNRRYSVGGSRCRWRKRREKCRGSLKPHS